MDDMLKEFVVEALELATNVEEHLLSLERNPEDANTINAVFRSFHTIKGGAGFMGLAAMVSACHLTENLFDALRTGKAPVTPIAIEAALEASGFVADQLRALANGTSADSLSSMPAQLEKILNNAIEGKAPALKPKEKPKAQEKSSAKATAKVMPELEKKPATNATGDGPDWELLYNAIVTSKHAASTEDVQEHNSIVDKIKEEGPIQEANAASVVAAREQSAKQVNTNATVKEDSIRIDAVKLDALLEVAGESVQAANQAAVLLEKLQQFKFEGVAATLMSTLAETLGRASRYSSELQRATLSTRMQPVGKLFQKFPRLVRELAKDLGKNVELAIEGAETEVDRVVVDSLYDPLVHMLRNALDHGIEDNATRVKLL